MSTLLLLIALAAFPRIDVALAPDQPVPHVYMEDPIILELVPSADLTLDAQLTVRPGNGASSAEPQIVELGSVSLRAPGAYWRPIVGVATQRGHYAAEVVLRNADGEMREERVFCRIDRPIESLVLPVGVRHEGTTEQELRATAAVGVRRITIAADQPELEARIADALDAGFGVSVYFPPGDVSASEALATSLAVSQGDDLVRWEFDGRSGAADLRRLVAAVRNSGGLAPVAVIVRSPDELAALLSQNAGHYVNVVVIEHEGPTAEALQAYRSAAEAAGFEREPLHIRGRGVAAGEDEGARLVQQLIVNAANDVAQTDIDASLVYKDGEFGSGYVMLSAYARRLDRGVYVGKLAVGSGGGQAHAFRIDDSWCVVFWGPESRADVTLDVGDATDLSLADVYNNPLSPPVVVDGSLRMDAGPTPAYLSGRGGPVLNNAARQAAKREAEAFAADEAVTAELPSDLAAIVAKVARNNGSRLDRPEFFALVRAFPYLERQWHSGQISQASAVAAMAGLSRLTRHLCVVEQESGEKFIEPLQDTLGRCSQFESLYLTQSRATNGQEVRGDWLLSEVDRLVAEAEALDRVGRSIEANALATMAEWRARSLEFAADAVPPEPIDAPPAIPVEPPAAQATPTPGAPLPVEDDAAAPPAPPIEDAPAEETVGDAQQATPEVETTENGLTKLELTVQRGDNPWAISQRYKVTLEDLRKWNNWRNNQVLHVGDKYIVYTKESR